MSEAETIEPARRHRPEALDLMMALRAAALAAFAALLGGAIALWARRQPSVLERTRTFAFAAAAGVVAFHLLPELLAGQGLAALAWIGAGFVLPLALEAASRLFGPGLLEGRGFSNFRVAAEVGFGALLFHSVAEGLALVAALARPRGQLDLEIALVAHHAPLTAAVVLPFLELKGPRSVAARALAVGAAGVLGAALSGALPGLTEGVILQRATAVTAGALLHVVSDEIEAQQFGSGWQRAADLLACAAGLLVAGVGAVFHLRDGRQAALVLEVVRALCALSLASAPALLLGAAASALLAWRLGRRISVEAIFLTFALLGWEAALFMALLEVALSLPLFRLVPAEAPRGGGLAELNDSMGRRGPSLLLLLFVAAAVQVGLPGPLLGAPGATLLVLAAVLLAARLDQAGAVALAAVLASRQLAPPLLIALLVLGPFTRGKVVGALLARGRWRGTLALVSLWLVALGAGLLTFSINQGLASSLAAARALSAAGEPVGAQILSSPLGVLSALLLLAVALGALWRAGARGWFAPLRHGSA